MQFHHQEQVEVQVLFMQLPLLRFRRISSVAECFISEYSEKDTFTMDRFETVTVHILHYSLMNNLLSQLFLCENLSEQPVHFTTSTCYAH